MTVMFDMDGVLADFIAGFRQVSHEMFGTPVEVDPANYTWDNYGGGIAENQVNKVWDRVKSDNNLSFWLGLAPLVDEVDKARIRRLAGYHAVYFVTSRVGKYPKSDTELWLRNVLDLPHPAVIVSSRKGEIAAGLGAHYCIDDKADNAVYVAYHSPKTKSYLFDAPYNQFPHETLGRRVRRVSKLSEFLDDVEAGR